MTAEGQRAIGSVFAAIADIVPPPGGGLLAGWMDGGADSVLLRNARAALALLLRSLNPARLWLPAYICRDAVEGAVAAGVAVAYFGQDATLAPDVGFLAAHLRPGDAVMAVDYFGRLPPVAFRDFCASRPDCHWIEDRAQAIAPGAGWGDYLLYSPRKVVGVPDGGVLVVRCGAAPAAAIEDFPLDDMPAVFRRLDDPAGERPDLWFPSFRAEEARMDARPLAMSRLARLLLDRIDPQPLIAARRANGRLLRQHLPDLLLWHDADDTEVPLGIPVVVPDAAAFVAEMAKARIWCARHWADLPSPPDEFPALHGLARRLVTLPCDQRYGRDDMMRIVDHVRRIVVQPR